MKLLGMNRKSFKKKLSSSGSVAEVLYQKMGNRWYTFLVVNDEVFVGSAPQHPFDLASERASHRNRKKSDIHEI